MWCFAPSQPQWFISGRNKMYWYRKSNSHSLIMTRSMVCSSERFGKRGSWMSQFKGKEKLSGSTGSSRSMQSYNYSELLPIPVFDRVYITPITVISTYPTHVINTLYVPQHLWLCSTVYIPKHLWSVRCTFPNTYDQYVVRSPTPVIMQHSEHPPIPVISTLYIPQHLWLCSTVYIPLPLWSVHCTFPNTCDYAAQCTSPP